MSKNKFGEKYFTFFSLFLNNYNLKHFRVTFYANSHVLYPFLFGVFDILIQSFEMQYVTALILANPSTKRGEKGKMFLAYISSVIKINKNRYP